MDKKSIQLLQICLLLAKKMRTRPWLQALPPTPHPNGKKVKKCKFPSTSCNAESVKLNFSKDKYSQSGPTYKLKGRMIYYIPYMTPHGKMLFTC